MRLSPWIERERKRILQKWVRNESSLLETVRALYSLGYSVDQAWEMAQNT